MPLKDTEGGPIFSSRVSFVAECQPLAHNVDDFTSFSSHEMIELKPAGWGYEVH